MMPIGGLVNKQLGAYRLNEMVSAGGVAEVYRASHADDGSCIAVKVMRSELCKDKQQVKAFKAEHEALAALKHPAVPQVRRFAEVAGRPAIGMEFFEGMTLHQCAQSDMRFDRVGSFLALVSAVAYIHEAGFVHNDLKLENVILRPKGRIGVVDFGNAKSIGGGLMKRLFGNRGRGVFGTPTYLAPELIKGGEPSPASDCYALGVACHVLVTGEAPFNDERRTLRLNRAVKEAAPQICQREPRLPKGFGSIIDSCLEKDPRHRPDDAGTLKNLLHRQFGSGMKEKVQELAALLA